MARKDLNYSSLTKQFVNTLKNKLSLLLAVIGLLNSFYLTLEHYGRINLYCPVNNTINCNAILQSNYSTLFGIPLSIFGLFYFSFLIILTLITMKNKDRYFRLLLIASETAGILASLVLVYIQFFLIKRICIFCMLSALICFLIFTLNILKFPSKQKIKLN